MSDEQTSLPGNANTNAFLIDEDSSIPFSLDEVALSFEDFPLDISALPAPAQLAALPSFAFLLAAAAGGALHGGHLANGHAAPIALVSPVPYGKGVYGNA